MFICSCVRGELIITHIRNTIAVHKTGGNFDNWQEIVATMLALLLGLMMSYCPVAYCFEFHAEENDGKGLLYEICW